MKDHMKGRTRVLIKAIGGRHVGKRLRTLYIHTMEHILKWTPGSVKDIPS
jgi:hypothetical protein